MPPSIINGWPVVYALSSEAKYTAIEAISLVVPNRPRGCLAIKSFRAWPGSSNAAIRSSNEGDCTVPGQMQLHLIPCFK